MKICFIDTHRSETSLLLPVIRESKKYFDIKIILSGSHLKKIFGSTINEYKDFNKIDIYKFDFLRYRDLHRQITHIYKKVSEFLEKEKPDGIYIDGDRYEKLPAVLAAYYSRIPIFHMGGGNITQGGCLDDDIRHVITKLSHLHFTTCEQTKKNVLRLGEEKWRVHNVGNTFIDMIKSLNLYTIKEIEKMFNVRLDRPFIVFTLHPLPMENNYKVTKQLLKKLLDKYIVFASYPNFDEGYQGIIKALELFKNKKNFILEKSFGIKMFFSLLKNCEFAVGNSSSFINETPFFKKYAIIYGKRQDGRIISNNVFFIDEIRQLEKIIFKIEKLDKQKIKNIFGDGTASKKIVLIIKKYIKNKSKLLNKKFI